MQPKHPFSKCLLFVLFSLLLTPCFSQDSSKVFFKGMLGAYAKKATIYYPTTFKVQSVEVIDNRPDTALLGLYRNWLDQDCYLNLDKTETLQQVFDSLLAGGFNNARIKIVLNHFFITNPPLLRGVSYQTFIGYIFPSMIVLNAKIYVQKDNCWQGMFKADTAFFVMGNTENNYKDLLYEAGLYISKNIQESLRSNNFIRHPKLSDKTLDSLNQPVIPKKLAESDTAGFFITFQDFIDGNLTKTDFTLSEVQNGLYYAYTPGKTGNDVLVRNIWGLTKNGKTYIMRNSILTPLIKINNAYYWKDVYGGRYKGKMIPFNSDFNKGTDSTGAPKKNTSIKYFFKSCMLNMQNGGSH